MIEHCEPKRIQAKIYKDEDEYERDADLFQVQFLFMQKWAKNHSGQETAECKAGEIHSGWKKCSAKKVRSSCHKPAAQGTKQRGEDCNRQKAEAQT